VLQWALLELEMVGVMAVQVIMAGAVLVVTQGMVVTGVLRAGVLVEQMVAGAEVAVAVAVRVLRRAVLMVMVVAVLEY
jgi:hypothetical protein